MVAPVGLKPTTSSFGKGVLYSTIASVDQSCRLCRRFAYRRVNPHEVVVNEVERKHVQVTFYPLAKPVGAPWKGRIPVRIVRFCRST